MGRVNRSVVSLITVEAAALLLVHSPREQKGSAPFNRQIELYKTPPHQTWWIWSCAAFSSPVPNLDRHSCEDVDVPVKARVSSAAHRLPSG